VLSSRDDRLTLISNSVSAMGEVEVTGGHDFPDWLAAPKIMALSGSQG